MPNIVEQQDLLKGLPDQRLALLLQQPSGNIPPFLVAAEAARRDAIRKQHSGNGSNESVVDSLTRQLANVPQNIKATPQPMPPVPPTPPMAGVAALQQGMAAGGPVRRFAEQGYVAPTLTSPFDYIRSTYPAGQFPGSISEAYGGISNAASQAWNSQIAKDAFDTMRVGAGRAIDLITLNPYNAQILGLDPVSVEENRRLMDENAIKANNPMAGQGASGEDSYRRAISDMEKLAGRKAQTSVPPDPNAGKTGTSTENQTAAADDELRNRLEALYADQGVSDMEKAQKWFAMASQFYDPELTTGQSIARAGLAFTEAAGNQAQAEREALRAREEALLKYDIGKQEAERAAAAAERERTSMSAKDTANVLTQRINGIEDLISQAKKSLDTMKADPMVSPENIAAAEKQITDLMKAREAVAGQLSSLVEQSYGPIKFETFSLTNGFQQ